MNFNLHYKCYDALKTFLIVRKSTFLASIVLSTTISVGSQAIAETCFGPDEVPPSVPPNGFAMPDLNAEKTSYTNWGWTWSASAEPNNPSEPDYTVSDPVIHGDTEGDDLWNNLMMYYRTGQNGFLDRAKAWVRYFEEDFANCVGGAYANYCYDKDAYGADHTWGWGLVSWYQLMGDQAALDAAEQIAAGLEEMYAATSGCLPVTGCTDYGIRGVARHLLLVTRVAEVTNKQRWVTLRDKIINIVLTTPDWNSEYGMYFRGEWSTDYFMGAGSYAAGARIQSAFQVGVMTEALDHAYRTTGRKELRDRIVAMAKFVNDHGIDPQFGYTGSLFGIVDGKTWHNYSSTEPVTFWDPVYTGSLVNTLMRGYRYTCDIRYFERAKYFFDRQNKGIYGEPVARYAADGEVHHFVDSVFRFYFSYNKGELQYNYLLFLPAMSDIVKPNPPVLNVR